MYAPSYSVSKCMRQKLTELHGEIDEFTIQVWRRKWQLTPVLLPGESHGRRSLVGYTPWGLKESDTTERLHTSHTSSLSLSSCNLRQLFDSSGCFKFHYL